MWRIFGGAALIVAGIAAFIEASSNAPESHIVGGECTPPNCEHFHTGLSQTAYDLLRIGAWALVIFGGVLLFLGLVAYVRRHEGAGD